MSKIILFDPSLQDNNGTLSTNLGDIIIYDAVSKFIEDRFFNDDIIRISTHSEIGSKEKQILKESNISFVGGTNLLSSDIESYNQWRNTRKVLFTTKPIVNNAILFGVGWWQYQTTPSPNTIKFYSKLLNNDFIHSVRDGYTVDNMMKLQSKEVVNTSCPTIWGLEGVDNNINKESKYIKNVCFTLTDYHPDEIVDSKIIRVLLDKFPGEIFYFPQGIKDKQYLESLEIFKENKRRFTILPHDINFFNKLLRDNLDIVYIGTRLHGGVRALQYRIPSLILSNDNRAEEIRRSINLPVIERTNIQGIMNWIERKSNMGVIKLPNDDIEKWKAQF